MAIDLQAYLAQVLVAAGLDLPTLILPTKTELRIDLSHFKLRPSLPLCRSHCLTPSSLTILAAVRYDCTNGWPRCKRQWCRLQ